MATHAHKAKDRTRPDIASPALAEAAGLLWCPECWDERAEVLVFDPHEQGIRGVHRRFMHKVVGVNAHKAQEYRGNKLRRERDRKAALAAVGPQGDAATSASPSTALEVLEALAAAPAAPPVVAATSTVAPAPAPATTPKRGRPFKHDTHTEVEVTQNGGYQLNGDVLIRCIGRTEEFIRGLADQAEVPARQLIAGVSEFLYRSSRR